MAAASSITKVSRQCALPGCNVKLNLKQCSKCKEIFYCCQNHQIADWPTHKKACGAKAKITGTGAPSSSKKVTMVAKAAGVSAAASAASSASGTQTSTSRARAQAQAMPKTAGEVAASSTTTTQTPTNVVGTQAPDVPKIIIEKPADVSITVSAASAAAAAQAFASPSSNVAALAHAAAAETVICNFSPCHLDAAFEDAIHKSGPGLFHRLWINSMEFNLYSGFHGPYVFDKNFRTYINSIVEFKGLNNQMLFNKYMDTNSLRAHRQYAAFALYLRLYPMYRLY